MSEFSLLMCVVQLLLLSVFADKTVGDTPQRGRNESYTVNAQEMACLSREDIQNALDVMAHGVSQNQAEQARLLLIKESTRSAQCKERVIRVVMSAMDKPDLDFTREPSMYYVWREGASLLGELRASEALDLLISHLDLTIGIFSSTMSQQPALWGLIKMGAIAIPKLDIVLRQSSNREMKRYAVYCIANIG